MDMTKKMLETVILSELQIVDDDMLTVEEKSKAITNLAVLYELKIKEAGTETKSERAFTKYFKIGTDLLAIVLPPICYGLWMYAGYRFEETGIVTSPTFKGMIKWLRPTK